MESTIESTVSKVWDKSKWLVKGCIIGAMALLLMIPMLYVKELVIERQERQKEASEEIISKWAGFQNIVGPVIGVPFWQSSSADTSGNIHKTKMIAYFLPDTLDMSVKVDPKEKHRGIFSVMLYDAQINMNGSFGNLDLEKLNIDKDQCIWNESFIFMHVADNKGLNEQLTLKLNQKSIELSPEAGNGDGRLSAKINAFAPDDLNNLHFSTGINISGSEKILFTPIGKSTSVAISSAWKHPSFTGSTLPQITNVTDTGFTATWKSLSHKRNFPQQWTGSDFTFNSPRSLNTSATEYSSAEAIKAAPNSISAGAFGVDLFIPVNDYQKTLRTIKYAILCILLTFAAFFLIETNNTKSAHPFQYGLIGLALVMFYTLLLSISEYTGFNVAYLIASLATVGLISWFVTGILHSSRATVILAIVLVLLHSYVFSLLQLQDYSLLFGSIGLFLMLAVVMYFSKKLSW